MGDDQPYTDAELEAGARALGRSRHFMDTDGYPSIRIGLVEDEARVVLEAVLPQHAARVRADELRRVVEQAEVTLAKLREHMLLGLQDADLDGDGGTKRINEWADHVDNQVRAAIARAHATTPTEGDRDA